MNNILILGGTGAMGEHLVKILSENTDNQIYVTSRSKHSSETSNIFYIEGNARENDFLLQILSKKEWDCIVDFMKYNTEMFNNRVNHLLNNTKQYVFLSSSRVYANSQTPITEKSPRLLDVCTDNEYLATDEYALTKARQENILFEQKEKNWTIIRPYITYSSQRLQLGVLEKEDWLFTALYCGILAFSEDIAKHQTTLTFGYDVARAMAALVMNEKAYARIFHITNPNSICWKEVFDIYSKVLKKHNVNFQEIIKEKTYRLENDRKYQVIYDRYFDRTFDNSSISEFVDVTEFTSPEIGLEQCLEEFLTKQIFRYVNIESVLKIIQGTNGNLPFKHVKGIKNKIKYLLIKLHLR